MKAIYLIIPFAPLLGAVVAGLCGLGFVMEGGNRSKSHGNKNTNGPRHTVLING
jgi:hypothetical protein